MQKFARLKSNVLYLHYQIKTSTIMSSQMYKTNHKDRYHNGNGQFFKYNRNNCFYYEIPASGKHHAITDAEGNFVKAKAPITWQWNIKRILSSEALDFKWFETRLRENSTLNVVCIAENGNEFTPEFQAILFRLSQFAGITVEVKQKEK